jgi:hypothetical protein
MFASSKMPVLKCIICTEAPYWRPTSAASSSPKTTISWPSGVRMCVGRSPSARVRGRCGANSSRPGSLLAVSHGIPLRSSSRRNAKRLSPSRPCQPTLATSRRSHAMDFTGYRKIASTCPIFMSMGAPSPYDRCGRFRAYGGEDRSASPRLLRQMVWRVKQKYTKLIPQPRSALHQRLHPSTRSRQKNGRGECFVATTDRNIWVDNRDTTLYVVWRLLAAFPGKRLKGTRWESGTAPQR